jgi:hypothetical protein
MSDMKDEDDFRGLFKTLPKDLRDELLKAVEESSATVEKCSSDTS